MKSESGAKGKFGTSSKSGATAPVRQNLNLALPQIEKGVDTLVPRKCRLLHVGHWAHRVPGSLGLATLIKDFRQLPFPPLVGHLVK